MLKLNHDILTSIFEYLDLDNIHCCKKSPLYDLIFINKNFKEIILGLLKFYKNYNLNFDFLKFNNICTKCDKLSDIEISKLLNLYKKYNLYKNDKLNYILKKHNTRYNFNEFINFENKENLNNFIDTIKCNKKINLIFGCKCCDGKGCKVNLQVPYTPR